MHDAKANCVQEQTVLPSINHFVQLISYTMWLLKLMAVGPLGWKLFNVFIFEFLREKVSFASIPYAFPKK